MKGKTILLATAAAAMMATTVAPASAADWWENTSINGRMYYDFTYLDKKTAGTKSSDSGTSFDIKRFYVGIDHKFNDVFSANVTTDFTYDAGAGATQVYIKKAYLEANLSPALDIRLGSTDLPWIPFVEGVYGYRYVENTLIDRTAFRHLGRLGRAPEGQVRQRHVRICALGRERRRLQEDRPHEGHRLRRPPERALSDFILAVGGYAGKLGATQGSTTYHTANRFDALAAYEAHGVRLGFEYFQANDWNNVSTSREGQLGRLLRLRLLPVRPAMGRVRSL